MVQVQTQTGLTGHRYVGQPHSNQTDKITASSETRLIYRKQQDEAKSFDINTQLTTMASLGTKCITVPLKRDWNN